MALHFITLIGDDVGDDIGDNGEDDGHDGDDMHVSPGVVLGYSRGLSPVFSWIG